MNRAERRRRDRINREVDQWVEAATADMTAKGEPDAVVVVWCLGELCKRHGTMTYRLHDYEGGDMSVSILDVTTGREVTYPFEQWHTEQLQQLVERAGLA